MKRRSHASCLAVLSCWRWWRAGGADGAGAALRSMFMAPRAARAATRAYSYSMYTVTIIQYYSYESRVSDPGSDLAFSPRGHGFQHSAACVVPSPSPHRMTETVSFVADTRHRVTLYVYLPRDRSSPCALSPITTHTHAWNYLMNIRLCTAKCSEPQTSVASRRPPHSSSN